MTDAELADHYDVSVATIFKHRHAAGIRRYHTANGPTHGTWATYTAYSCRCEACVTTVRQINRAAREKRYETTAANGGIAPFATHGTASTATNWGCRCEPCLAAKSESNKRSHERRKNKNKDGNH